ncbi:MAG: threonine synthase [Promethearchaeota archaeon]
MLHSTNYKTEDVDFKTAVLRGQALDNGLYMLNQIPKINQEIIFNFKNLELREIAFNTLYRIIKNDIPETQFKNIINNALNFGISIEHIQNNDNICYLSKGPTCSFKDFGARILARILEYFLKIDDKELIILTATSGDTGGAVAQAFYEMAKIKVIVIYPKNEISELQRKQMTTLGKNVTAIGINGKFDDCQRLVKTAFTDKDLKYIEFSSANSINFGRLLPQIIYYFWSYSRIVEKIGEKIIFSVPSGNFGNLTGGLISYKMGLPVLHFISAVNENDEFPRFLESGIYEKVVPSRKCISSAMNVGHPSNLARIFDLYKGQIDENGIIQKTPNLKEIRKDIKSYSITDELTRNTIIEFYKKFKKIIDPHGAVGWAALQNYRNTYPRNNKIKSITFETADPSKFPNEIFSLINIKPKITSNLEIIQNKKEISNTFDINNYQDFKLFLKNNF